MTSFRKFLIIAFILLSVFLTALPTMAQTDGFFAYTNSGGQLVITRPGNDYRWIVTNPGETLLETVDLSWSLDGSLLLYGVGSGNGYSLRVADTARQQVFEVANGSGYVSNGEWTTDGGVMVTTNEGIVQIAPGSGAALRVAGGQMVGGASVSPDGAFMLYHANGQLALTTTASGGAESLLPGQNRSPMDAGIGLWDGSRVAYWTTGASGTSVVGVTDTRSGETLALDTGSGVPVTPIGWVPGQNTLVFLSANGVQAVDTSCVTSGGCGAVPSLVTLLPVTAQDVAISTDGLLTWTLDGTRYVDGGNCLASGNCAATAVPVGSVLPRNPSYTGGNVTAFTSATDGTLQVVDLACTAGGGASCGTAVATPGTVVGVAPNGAVVLAVANNQLVAVENGNLTSLGNADAALRIAWSD
jgi:hypothetical protein